MGRRKKPLLTNLTIESLSSTGKGVAKLDSQVVFVEKTAPGDVVNAQVTRKKKSFMEARPTEYLTLGESRTEPFCSHFGTCGGCKWQHIDYAEQLKAKQDQVDQNLKKLAKVEVPKANDILPAPQQKFFRNKLEFTFSQLRWIETHELELEDGLERRGLGFHIPGRFDRILNIDTCYLQDDYTNEIRNTFRDLAFESGYSFYHQHDQVGFFRNLVVRNTNLGQWMVILIVGEKDHDKIKSFMKKAQAKLPKVASWHYVVNTKVNDQWNDQPLTHFAGEYYVFEEMSVPDLDEKLNFRIGPRSFFQTNSAQAQNLYNITHKAAALKGDELVYDLYTGTGSIACFVAKAAGKVVGIEYVPAAIEDAKINAANNGIDNCDFFAGDMKDLLTESFFAANGRPDVIICDPPRAGMHPDVTQQILHSGAMRIVYVSCNSATQARDLFVLKEKYNPISTQAVDMFPHTAHVENVVVLVKK